MKHKILSLLTTAIVLLASPLVIWAATKEYGISAINLSLQIPDTLNVLTRNVSEGNEALEKLENVDAIKIQNSFIQHHIYLNAFPDDLSYEILVTATAFDDDSDVNFSAMSDDEFAEYINNLTDGYIDAEYQQLLEATAYTVNNLRFVKTKVHSTQNDLSVYNLKYHIAHNDYLYGFSVQTNSEITAELEQTLTDIVDTAQFMEIDSQVTESGLFMEFYEMMIGFGITVLILGAIFFLLLRSSKK